jgi:hypothetical protein
MICPAAVANSARAAMLDARSPGHHRLDITDSLLDSGHAHGMRMACA